MEKNDRENMDVEKRENRAVTESLTRIKGEAFCERTVLCIPRHFTRIGEEAFPGKSEDRTVRGTEDRDLYRGACILWLQCIKTSIPAGNPGKAGKGLLCRMSNASGGLYPFQPQKTAGSGVPKRCGTEKHSFYKGKPTDFYRCECVSGMQEAGTHRNP